MIINGDCLEVLKSYPDNYFTSIITDPPYGLSFMGKKWDYDVPSLKIWKECLRVLKHGGTMLCFAGSRTQHRMACNVEDAGFLIKDCLMWLYGSGFPKSYDISKGLDKLNGRCQEIYKPFAEYIKTKRLEKKLSMSDIDNILGTNTAYSWWEGRLKGIQLPSKYYYLQLKKILDLDNRFDELIERIEAEREIIGEKSSGLSGGSGVTVGCFTDSRNENGLVNITAPETEIAKQFTGYGTALKPAYEPILMAMKPNDGTYAENAIKWGVSGIYIEDSRIGKEVRFNPSSSNNDPRLWRMNKGEKGRETTGRFPANILLDEEAAQQLGEPSRFFYCAKASSKERNEGCDELEEKEIAGCYGEFAGDGRGRQTEHQPQKNNHPTVKPLKLMQYLINLIMPPKDGLLLDPFAGSGTTLVAAKKLGYDAIGIEREAEYCKIANARIANVSKQMNLLNIKCI